MENNTSSQPSPEFKEQRIRKIALSYYSRKDVLEALYRFSQNREISPQYFEGFGKRPDSFQYHSDILALVKNGATSFHCSEEIWQDPLQLSTDLDEEQLNDLRTGWDLIIDIDCKWIDISKKAVQAIIRALEINNVKNIGIKFSGSKGFHIIIPWQAFPEAIGEIQTKDMFPEWPKAIVNYLKELSRPRLAHLIKDMDLDFTKEKGFTGIECNQCHNIASENYKIDLKCQKCIRPYIESFTTSIENYKQKHCPYCGNALKQTEKQKFYVCNNCRLNSLTSPNNFSEKITENLFEILGFDIQLVSSRHLFRMPYSLHEKTALSSIVIPKEKIQYFNIQDANPLNVNIIEFLPIPEKDEARQLLIHAIDWQKHHEIEQSEQKIKYKEQIPTQKNKKFEPIKIQNLTQDLYPPTINKILQGMHDGKKRALFILINFFRSLGQSIEQVEKIVNDWNKKNKPQLKQGYINAQLMWHSKNKIILPPNFDNEIYKAIGVLELDPLSEKIKNPVNYVIRKSGIWKNKK